jgi:hypothetical protein
VNYDDDSSSTDLSKLKSQDSVAETKTVARSESESFKSFLFKSMAAGKPQTGQDTLDKLNLLNSNLIGQENSALSSKKVDFSLIEPPKFTKQGQKQNR